ncbi:hypothetical protein SKAU_G00302810 [Synaphobranchus kaupii]|uniref:Uncharacterized protein n=1 Tax=Synaphobranchus kaupii TaxID=118154 RepID=A0A9Q1EW02_SYNKA|nr:hypothetical protein SKAU_G00302810 [Synaphobranchus kaupii]
MSLLELVTCSQTLEQSQDRSSPRFCSGFQVERQLSMVLKSLQQPKCRRLQAKVSRRTFIFMLGANV